MLHSPKRKSSIITKSQSLSPKKCKSKKVDKFKEFRLLWSYFPYFVVLCTKYRVISKFVNKNELSDLWEIASANLEIQMQEIF